MTPSFPAVICDLDGVVYRGNEPVPGSPEALRRLLESGVRVLFATNNSSRTPLEVVEKIERVTGLLFDVTDVVTSGQAAARLIPDDVSRCLVLGGPGLRTAISGTGRDIDGSPSSAECVVVGIDPEFNYEAIAAAAMAIREGAVFIASNVDPTFPTAAGLLPGAGAIVAAVAVASGREPIVAGKPEDAMRGLIRDRGVGAAWVVGDRIDTDIEMAVHESDWTSVLVMTGVTDAKDDLSLADHVVADLAEAVGLVLTNGDRQ